jgi:hypothetical protein
MKDKRFINPDPKDSGFFILYDLVAQLVEHYTFNVGVFGS